MRKKSMGVICLIASLCMSLFAGCGKPDMSTDFTVTMPTGQEKAGVYVEAIPNISDDFIRGMDASLRVKY